MVKRSWPKQLLLPSSHVGQDRLLYSCLSYHALSIPALTKPDKNPPPTARPTDASNPAVTFM
jgi:hypothetical protein